MKTGRWCVRMNVQVSSRSGVRSLKLSMNSMYPWNNIHIGSWTTSNVIDCDDASVNWQDKLDAIFIQNRMNFSWHIFITDTSVYMSLLKLQIAYIAVTLPLKITMVKITASPPQGWFSRIRQVVPMCTPSITPQGPIGICTVPILPSAESLWVYRLPDMSWSRPFACQIAPFMGASAPHLIRGSLGRSQSQTKRHFGWFSSSAVFTQFMAEGLYNYNGRPLSQLKIAPFNGDLDPLGPPSFTV